MMTGLTQFIRRKKQCSGFVFHPEPKGFFVILFDISPVVFETSDEVYKGDGCCFEMHELYVYDSSRYWALAEYLAANDAQSCSLRERKKALQKEEIDKARAALLLMPKSLRKRYEKSDSEKSGSESGSESGDEDSNDSSDNENSDDDKKTKKKKRKAKSKKLKG